MSTLSFISIFVFLFLFISFVVSGISRFSSYWENYLPGYSIDCFSLTLYLLCIYVTVPDDEFIADTFAVSSVLILNHLNRLWSVLIHLSVKPLPFSIFCSFISWWTPSISHSFLVMLMLLIHLSLLINFFDLIKHPILDIWQSFECASDSGYWSIICPIWCCYWYMYFRYSQRRNQNPIKHLDEVFCEFAKQSISDVWQGSEYVSISGYWSTCYWFI